MTSAGTSYDLVATATETYDVPPHWMDEGTALASVGADRRGDHPSSRWGATTRARRLGSRSGASPGCGRGRARSPLATRIREALGGLALEITHVGSTSVPGLPAKPVIDINLTVADSADEGSWLPDLEAAGFELVIREPWWHGDRCQVSDVPRANLHVFSPD
jgi:hypothetical protein